jgi:hypothetical protein
LTDARLRHSGDTIDDEVHALLLDEYEEFKLDRAAAPHTVGSSHMYIRKSIVRQAEDHKIVPPYPVTFPHGYPEEHANWYLDRMERHGSGRVVKRREDGA